ncbi:MAG: hypothetical protein WBX25_34165 [Rhodomicrobium sp.]
MKRIAVLAVSILSLAYAAAAFLRVIATVKGAPQTLKDLGELWWIHAFSDPKVFIAVCISAAWLIYLAYSEGWVANRSGSTISDGAVGGISA